MSRKIKKWETINIINDPKNSLITSRRKNLKNYKFHTSAKSVHSTLSYPSSFLSYFGKDLVKKNGAKCTNR